MREIMEIQEGFCASFKFRIKNFCNKNNKAGISKFSVSGIPWEIRVYENENEAVLVRITNLSDRDYFGVLSFFAEKVIDNEQTYLRNIRFLFKKGKEIVKQISDRRLLEKENLLCYGELNLIVDIRITDDFGEEYYLPQNPFYCDTLKRFLANPEYCDLQLQIGSEILPVHSFILADRSPVFEELIKNKKEKIIQIFDISFEQLKFLVNFIYHDSIEGLKEKEEEYYKIAILYKLPRLVRMCEIALNERLNVHNSLNFFILSADAKEILHCQTLYYIIDHIAKIVTLPEWEALYKEKPSLFYEIFKEYAGTYDTGEFYRQKSQIQEGTREEKSTESENDIQEIVNDLSELFEKQLFTDVTFRVGSQEIKGHKSILSCRSTVFNAMFSHDFKEKLTNIVEIEGIEFEVFQELLRFLYSSKVRDLDRYARELFKAADFYNIKTLKKVSLESIKSQMNVDNFFELFEEIPDELRSGELKEAIVEFVNRNLGDLIYDSSIDEKMKNLVANHSAFFNEILMTWVQQFATPA